MPDRKILKSEILINTSVQIVWDFFADAQNLIALCRAALGIRVMMEDAALNPYSPDEQRYVFKARLTPYDILISSTGCSYAIRLLPYENDCRLITVVSFDETAFVRPSEQMLARMNNTVKAYLEKLGLTTQVPTQTARQTQAPQFAVARLQPSEPPLARDQLHTKDAGVLDLMGQGDARAHTKQKQKNPKKKKSGAVIGIVALLVVALVAAYFFIPEIKSLFTSIGEPTAGYSARVTAQNALSVQFGMERRAVEQLFGTSGVPGPNGSVIYRGGQYETGNVPPIQVCIEYAGQIVAKLTYLNMEQAMVVSQPYNSEFPVTADMQLSDIEAGAGTAVSMVRKYKDAGNDIVEYHFGYTDPFANFDPAWRGEMVLTVNATDNICTKRFWAAYDGSDPLLVESLSGHPLANQYQIYTNYLNDKYQYDYALYMLNRFSRGDVVRVFGEMTPYSNVSGVDLYAIDSQETLPDAETPTYRMSFGFDSRGYFLMSSFCNMRLFTQPGALKDSDYMGITRGMAYNEIRQIMRILPTALFVDKSYFTLCYGMRLDSDIFEKQFEFMVRFDLENNYVQAMWVNTAKAETGNS